MIRPLVKTKRDGTLYVRPPEIETEIHAVLNQDLNLLVRRAEIRDWKASDFLSSECLVHLIREALRRGHEEMYDKLLPLLLERCAITLRSKVDWKIATAPQLCQEIISDFSELFAADNSPHGLNELDFFEVRFNLAFQTFRITRVRLEIDRLNREKALPDPEFPDDPIDEEVLRCLSDLYLATTDPEQVIFRKQVYAAIMALPPDERRALILCYYLGFKEESEDPNERTAATICGVTGRTIRNRLVRAIAKVSRLKEAQ
ncbi:MAG: hypothetical protein HY282_07570 [Nitrospirae bacterium]|nr:hypothetical protein [Candidatus Manganitrophaceae bacterium]